MSFAKRKLFSMDFEKKDLIGLKTYLSAGIFFMEVMKKESSFGSSLRQKIDEE